MDHILPRHSSLRFSASLYPFSLKCSISKSQTQKAKEILKMPNKTKNTQTNIKSNKKSWSIFLLDSCSWACSFQVMCLMFDMFNYILWNKTDFSQHANHFLVMDRILCSVPSLHFGIISCLDLGRSCVCCPSIYVFICGLHCCVWKTVSLYSFFPFGSYNYCTFSAT